MPNQINGQATTLNVISYGPMHTYLEEVRGLEVVLVQETHVTEEKLRSHQARALDSGFHGLWAPALPTPGGSQGGVAVRAHTIVGVTPPPGREDAIHAVAAGTAAGRQGVGW